MKHFSVFLTVMMILGLISCGAPEEADDSRFDIFTFSIMYDGNGNTGGTVPVDSNKYEQGKSITVLGNTGNLEKGGYYFDGWNTTANGDGTDYAVYSTLVMGDDHVVLYSKWTPNPSFDVSYDGNGATGGAVPIDSVSYETGQNVIVLGNTGNLVKTGAVFEGWNTENDGSGTDYSATSTFAMGTENVILYALWSEIVESPQFSVDGGIYYSTQNVDITCSTSGATITYTTDGSDPKTSGTAITGPAPLTISVDSIMTVKAFAAKTGGVDSGLAEVFYIIPPIRLPKTGQTSVFAANDDGSLQKGVAWPSPRFTDNGDGTITDHLTGLMWEQTPSLSGTLTENFTQAADSSFAGYTDWRLPNINELRSLANFGQGTSFLWLNSQGFIGIGATTFYRSSSANAFDTDYSYLMFFDEGNSQGSGYQGNASATTTVLMVRTGTTGTISLRKTGQNAVIYPNDDGATQLGVAWPDPRFLDNGDGTITDMLTGLMWDSSTDVLGTSLNWEDALDYAKNSNVGGYTDWRLPNINELVSLIDYSQSDIAAWLISKGFNVPLGEYMSSTTSPFINTNIVTVMITQFNSSFNVINGYGWSKSTSRTFICVRGGE